MASPPSRPPPPEAADLTSLFRKFHPQFDRRSGELVRDWGSDASVRLVDRMTALTGEAAGDLKRLEALDHPAIVQYWYLMGTGSTDPQVQGLFWRLSQGGLTAREACRALDKIETESVSWYIGYEWSTFFGRDPGARVEGLYFFLGQRGITPFAIAQACQESAAEVADPSRRAAQGRQRNLFTLLTEVEKSSLYYAPPDSLKKERERLGRTILTSDNPAETEQAAIRFSYITFVERGRRISTPTELRVKACLEGSPGASQKVCEEVARHQQVLETLHPFDNLRLRQGLRDRLIDFYATYSRLTPQERVRPDTLLLDGTLAYVAQSEEFGSATPLEEIFGEARKRHQVSHTPPDVDHSLVEILSTKEAIEVRVERLPEEIKALAKKIQLDKETTAWDFIQSRLHSVIFTPGLAPMQSVGEPEGIALRLFRTAVVNLNGTTPPGAKEVGLVAWLVHQASHMNFRWPHHVSGRGRGARLEDERQAFSRSAKVYEEAALLPEFPFSRQALRALRDSHWTLVRAANLGLAHPLEDLPPKGEEEIPWGNPRLLLHPTAFLNRLPPSK